MQIGKKTMIFLLIFSILSVSLTIACIIYTKMNWTDQYSTVIIDGDVASSEENTLTSTVTIDKETDILQTYSSNALKITEKSYSTGESSNQEYSEKLSIKYPEISNLSDATIQVNLNNDIKEKAFSLYSEDDLNNPDIEHIEITARATANFSDVLSIKIEIIKKYTDDSTYEDFSGVNYKLKSGEKIKFKNMFISGASIKSIIRHYAYISLAWEFQTDQVTDMAGVDYHDLSDDVYNILLAYSENDNPNFYFDEQTINAKINNKKIEISMIDSYNQIAIYTRYISDTSLYASETKATNIPILTQRDEYSEMDVYMVVNKNLIIDMNLNIEGIDKNSSAVNTAIANYKAALESSIELLESYSDSDKDEYVYFVARITAEIDADNNKIIFYENTYKYTAYSASHFEVYITSPVLTAKREKSEDISKAKFNLNNVSIKVEELSGTVEYNLTTGSLYGENEVEVIESIENEEENQDEIQQAEDINTSNTENTTTSTDENNSTNDITNTNNITNTNSTEGDDGEITATVTY